uniref:Cilia- and flagella-associated protein 157 n=1 Tax=Bursaphelenchus xylophilus TaxID=6326 RepID=A0A1I7SIG0_BURXY
MLVKRTEKDRDKIGQLERTIEEMEKERQMRAKQMEEREKEMLEFEDHYGKENKNLWEMVEKLKAENRYLQNTMEKLAEETVEEKQKQVLAEEEFDLLRNLKHQNLEQQEKIRDLHEQLKISEGVEKTLRKNVEELIAETERMLRKNKSIESQCRTLWTERNNYVKAQEELEEQNLRLKKTLDQTSRACNDLKNQQDIQQDKEDVCLFWSVFFDNLTKCHNNYWGFENFRFVRLTRRDGSGFY